MNLYECVNDETMLEGAIESPQSIELPSLFMNTLMRVRSGELARFAGMRAYEAHVPVGSGSGST